MDRHNFKPKIEKTMEKITTISCIQANNREFYGDKIKMIYSSHGLVSGRSYHESDLSDLDSDLGAAGFDFEGGFEDVAPLGILTAVDVSGRSNQWT
jgi:poly-beta-hydroxyalkanoate depolymerase